MIESKLPTNRVEELLRQIENVRIGVLGDMCLDLYWTADMKRSRLSRETPHFPLPVVRETASPGGAGNVAASVAALCVRSLVPLAVIGADWRGALLADSFRELGIDGAGLIRSASRVTPAYCKPMRAGISNVVYEDPRIDFENYESLSAVDEALLLRALDEAAKNIDVLAVSDQLLFGCVTPAVRARLAELSAAGLTVVVDSRDRIAEYRNVIVKPNELEAALTVGAAQQQAFPALYEPIARALREKTGRPAIVTLGENGALWAEGDDVFHAPSPVVSPPIDIVGAGDTFLAALCCALAAKAPGWEAIAFANLAAAVTVQKIGTTGSASPAEIREQSRKMI